MIRHLYRNGGEQNVLCAPRAKCKTLFALRARNANLSSRCARKHATKYSRRAHEMQKFASHCAREMQMFLRAARAMEANCKRHRSCKTNAIQITNCLGPTLWYHFCLMLCVRSNANRENKHLGTILIDICVRSNCNVPNTLILLRVLAFRISRGKGGQAEPS